MRAPRLLASLAASTLLSLPFLGCGAPQTQPELSKSMTSSEVGVRKGSHLSVEEAEKIVLDARAKFIRPDDDNPLRKPKSLDDVLAILQTDQIDLFRNGTTFARAEKGAKARALEAQLYIAWGEAERIAAQMLDVLDTDLRDEIRQLEELEATGKLDDAEKKRLERTTVLVNDSEPLIAAFSRLAPVHLAEGKKLADGLVAKKPEGYEGYRVLADYYRLRGDWQNFDAMVSEVEKLNPNSNGLAFLKGIALAEKKRDFAGAANEMRAALAKDPKFTRAQVQLVLFTDGFTNKYAEFKKLEKLSPQHQLVLLVGPVMEEEFAVREKRRDKYRRLEMRLDPIGAPPAERPMPTK